jgi:hypothetical protein
MRSRPTLERADSRRRPGRRQFLASLGAVAAFGLAGCSGSGDGDAGDDDSGDGGDGTSSDGGAGDGDAVTDSAGDGATGDGGSGTDGGSDGSGSDDGESSDGSASALACSDLNAGYTAYSGGDGALIAGFEVPTVLAGATEVVPVGSQVWVRAVRPLAADGDAQFHLSITQANESRETAGVVLDVEETVTEVEFRGETLTVSKFSGTELSGVEQLRVSLPYDSGDGTRYYPFTVQLEVENAPGGEVTETCDAAIDEAARHVMESLQPDPDTSFGEPTAAALSQGHRR